MEEQKNTATAANSDDILKNQIKTLEQRIKALEKDVVGLMIGCENKHGYLYTMRPYLSELREEIFPVDSEKLKKILNSANS